MSEKYIYPLSYFLFLLTNEQNSICTRIIPRGQLYGDNPYVCPTWETLDKVMYPKYYESLSHEMSFMYFAQTYLQPYYGNGVLGNVYLLAGQH